MTEPPVDDQADSTNPASTQSTGRTVTIGTRQVDEATLLRALGLLWIVLVGWWVEGLIGVTVGLAIAGITVVAQPIVVVAVAHAGFLLLVPELATVSSLIEIGLLELGVVAVLLSERPVEIPAALLTVAFGSTFIVGTVAALIWVDLLAASVLLVVCGVLLAYGIHRYERVSLGLVDDEPTTTDHGATK